jgi:hypothetical protein
MLQYIQGMDAVKLAFNTIHSLFASIFGITMIDVLSLSQFDFLKKVDDDAKHLFLIVGFIYYVVALLHKLKMNGFKRRERQLEVQSQELELKIKYEKYDLDKHKKEIGFEDPE